MAGNGVRLPPGSEARARTNMAGNMARKMGWVAASLALFVGAGCTFSIEKLGVGDSCRQERECLSGLQCVDRICVSEPRPETPESTDEPINANIPVPTIKPAVEADSGADAGPDAGADGG